MHVFVCLFALLVEFTGYYATLTGDDRGFSVVGAGRIAGGKGFVVSEEAERSFCLPWLACIFPSQGMYDVP